MERNPVLERLVLTLRDPMTQGPAFRDALKEVGYHLGVEIARNLPTAKQGVRTIMDEVAYHRVVVEDPVLICLLRAGEPLYLGVQRAFPNAEAGFVGTARDEETLLSKISYAAIPDVRHRNVVIVDTMLATGGSFSDVATQLIKPHGPARIIAAAAIASKQGVARLGNEGLEVYAAVTDPTLNGKGYIVPGLGDAGDRCFGLKMPLDL